MGSAGAEPQLKNLCVSVSLCEQNLKWNWIVVVRCEAAKR